MTDPDLDTWTMSTPAGDDTVTPLGQNRRSHTQTTSPRRVVHRGPPWTGVQVSTPAVPTDRDGTQWPVTPGRCRVCRFPLDPVNADRGTHPACDPAGTTDEDTARRLLAEVLGAVVIGEAP